jgi:hypothetical protein
MPKNMILVSYFEDMFKYDLFALRYSMLYYPHFHYNIIL